MSCHHSQTPGTQERIPVRLAPNVGSHHRTRRTVRKSHKPLGPVPEPRLPPFRPHKLVEETQTTSHSPPCAATLCQFPDALHTKHWCFPHQVPHLSHSYAPHQLMSHTSSSQSLIPFHSSSPLPLPHPSPSAPLSHSPCPLWLFIASLALLSLFYPSYTLPIGHCFFAASL